ncbi:MAG: hypothetical protein WC728_06910 [Elusimicrobiota bacterium]
MRMPAVLLMSSLLSPIGASTLGERLPSDAVDEMLYDAHMEVRSGQTYALLLMISAQASFRRMGWSFGTWGLKDRQTAARRRYESVSELVGRWRDDSEMVGAMNDPLAPLKTRLWASSKVRAAGDAVPDSPAEQLEMIRRMRGEYDGDANRSSLRRAQAFLARIESRLGSLPLTRAQEHVVSLGQDVLTEIRRLRSEAAESMPPPKADKNGAQRRGRHLVAEDLSRIDADVVDLETELSKLRILYQLNNRLSTGDMP